MAHLALPMSTLCRDTAGLLDQLLPLVAEVELRPVWRPVPPQGRRVSVHMNHGPAQASAFEQEYRDWALPEALHHDASCLSFDFGPAVARHRGIFPLAPPLTAEAFLTRMRQAVAAIRLEFPGALALENLAYYPTGLFNDVCDPDFIADALEALDCALLLDMAHASVSAANMRIDFRQYLSRLPLHRLTQLHVSGAYVGPSLAVDAHRAPQQRDWDDLLTLLDVRGTLKGIGVCIEYYRDAETILAAYATLRTLLDAHGELECAEPC